MKMENQNNQTEVKNDKLVRRTTKLGRETIRNKPIILSYDFDYLQEI